MSEHSFVGASEASSGAWSAHAGRFFGPLFERFRLGEGLLLVVNAAVLGLGAPDLATALLRLVLSVGVLAAVYSVNDLHDAEADRANPKKNQRLVALLLEARAPYRRVLFGVHVGLVALAGLALGAGSALVVAAMLGVNLAYSLRAKGTPLVDLVAVALWGGLFTAIAAAPLGLCALVGALTVLMHVFQMQVDVEVDADNAVRTTAVVTRRPRLLVAAASLAVAGVLASLLGPLWAATAVVPLLADLGLRHTETAWMCSRVWAGIVILAALGALPGVG